MNTHRLRSLFALLALAACGGQSPTPVAPVTAPAPLASAPAAPVAPPAASAPTKSMLDLQLASLHAYVGA